VAEGHDAGQVALARADVNHNIGGAASRNIGNEADQSLHLKD
jgi:hypothetical protein